MYMYVVGQNFVIKFPFISNQTSELLQVFLLVVKMLQELSESQTTSWSRDDVAALMRFLSLAEQVLSWGFTLNNHIL